MNNQAHEYRISSVGVPEFVSVSLFSEVEVGSHGVFEEVNNQISQKNKKRGILPAQFQTCGKHFHQRRSQHEAGPEGNKILQVGTVPVFLNDDGAAEYIGRGSSQA